MDKIYILILIAVVISYAISPLVKKIAKKTGAIDIPKNERKIHKEPIPLLGGLSIYIAVAATMLLKTGGLTKSETGILAGATIIVAGGILDDIYDLRPLKKLLFQVTATLFLIWFNVRIQILTNPVSLNDTYFSIGWLSIPLTFIWVIGITNALNLIDGLDGLAAGISFISALTLFIIASLNHRYDAMLLSGVLCGSIAGFLPYNFNPASIFMGDTGSQLLGFLLAAISIEGAIKSAAAFAIVVPILTLGLPIYDTLFAIIRRKINGKPIMEGDKGHLHHRLLDSGLSHRQTVIVMYIISAVLGGLSIIAMQLSNVNSYFLLGMVLLLTVFIAWRYGFFKQKD
jgi:UDP-GlcNAc:undecaprenyl-phosphate GlcNAc-1-phosphate transferase